MNYILLGAAGFLLMHLLDFASMKGVLVIKPVLWLLGTGMLVVAAVMTAVTGPELPLPLWLAPMGWVLLFVSVYMMVYSLYVALPFGKTYVEPGSSGQLVTGGLYRLVRHPWLLFFALSMGGLTLASRSILALEAGIIWTVLSAGLVYLQDRWIFPRMFPGYTAYQKVTPMLVPTKNSLSAFLKGLKRNKLSEVQTK
ncbi:methyltransferase [Dehalogenimonas sp. THU2]|uniref:methyltransferase family protein n=1 Tax=Dehalogenimonas sp. THU2 TaxID=3151121 RepID=UPI003218C0D3